MKTKYIYAIAALVLINPLTKLHSKTDPKLIKKVQASLMGTTIGDRLGFHFENPMDGSKKPEVFKTKTLSKPSDDTACSLALGISLLENHGNFEAEDYAKELIDWEKLGHYDERQKPCFGGGRNMREMIDAMKSALKQGTFKSTYDPRYRQGDCHSGNLGNGGLMKMGPAVLVNASETSMASAIQTSTEVLNLTHKHTHAQQINIIATTAMWHGLNQGLEAAINYLRNASTFDPYITNEIQAAINHAENGKQTTYGEQNPMFAVITFKTVVFGIFRANKLEEGGALENKFPHHWKKNQRIAVRTLQETIYQGGDTDTTAAIAGMMIGAMLGDDCWPEELTNQVKWKNEIMQLGEMLAERDFDKNKIQKLKETFCHKSSGFFSSPVSHVERNPGKSILALLFAGATAAASKKVIGEARQSKEKSLRKKIGYGLNKLKESIKEILRKMLPRKK